MADLPKPCMWTLSETVAARQTTSRGLLWFGNPKNSGWEPLFTADQLRAYAAAKVAEERERCARLCETARDAIWQYHDAAVKQAAENVCENLAAAIRGTEAASRGET